MKKMFLLVFVLVISVSQSDAMALTPRKQAIAEYTFGINDFGSEDANVGEYVLKKYTATLFTDQTLKIVEVTTRGDNQWNMGNDNQEQVIRIPRLQKAVYDILFQDVIALADAEIQQTHSAIVCMMMPMWPQSQDHLKVARTYDYNTKTFKGELLLVDGPHGCWLANKTFPKDEYAHQTAHTLKRSIKLLAL
ncbi:MAG: hypothetical protein HYV97_05475 [Bdellovibrio sp.]|nr:hypothetical protein [Bdellovibrio sp.]